jgi:hypothetical protein
MSNTPDSKKPAALHVEVAIAALIAGVLITSGLIATVWTKSWTPALLCSIIACGLLFVAACIPQIKTAIAERNERAQQ